VARAWEWQAKLNYRLLQPNWDFNQSWASNLAAVGSILGIVVGASSGLPSGDLALTAVVLSVFFGALIVLGPITFGALQVSDGASLVGTLWAFFIASGLTLWAALGEAVTAAAFFLDLRQKLPASIVWLFVAVVALAVLMLLRYAWLGMGSIAKLASPPLPKGSKGLSQAVAWHLI